ncbi:oxidized purine nucleoside triphosphate hydrolase-like [Tubulanus polymorphus]|uniref:oxidized purine nucleoside triphosphate hydrolase-like n=1 Tax=Tubulanus polymorphus TaxID=672921 RepID=UPI003DA2B89B
MTTRKLLTLVMVRRPAEILLGMKKRGFGEGRWNGFGGKVHPGETVVDAAKRELHEESSLIVDKLDEIGLLTFEFVGDSTLLEVHVFTTTQFKNEPEESEEMRPRWFSTERIPFDEMWPDDRYWFPYLLKGIKFKGYFKFEGHNKILDYTLNEVESLNFSNKLFHG